MGRKDTRKVAVGHVIGHAGHAGSSQLVVSEVDLEKTTREGRRRSAITVSTEGRFDASPARRSERDDAEDDEAQRQESAALALSAALNPAAAQEYIQ